MEARRPTIMVLIPGRSALSFAAPRSVRRLLTLVLLTPLLSGMIAQRCVASLRAGGPGVAIASLSRVHVPSAPAHSSAGRAPSPPPAPKVAAPRSAARALSVLPDLEPAKAESPEPEVESPEVESPEVESPEPEAPAPEHGLALASTVNTHAASTAVVNVKSILDAIARHHRGRLTDDDLELVPHNGLLRLAALHLGESISVYPFDAAMQPDPAAFTRIDHLMRCRITGEEIDIDPRLIAVLVRLGALYGKEIQLVSGHRVAHTIGTKSTSQHVLGRAADIRIPGVGIEAIKRAAIKFGARGVGLYPEKGFVHVDVRQKKRYYWTYTAAGGEQSDMGYGRPAHHVHAELASVGFHHATLAQADRHADHDGLTEDQSDGESDSLEGSGEGGD